MSKKPHAKPNESVTLDALAVEGLAPDSRIEASADEVTDDGSKQTIAKNEMRRRQVANEAERDERAVSAPPSSIEGETGAMKVCKARRGKVESTYQAALGRVEHRVCSGHEQCVLLPRVTLCSQRSCVYDGAPINRRYAKKVKALQYDVDAKLCLQLTRECASNIITKRRTARCKIPPYQAVCREGVASELPLKASTVGA